MDYRIVKFLPFLFVLALVGCAARDGLVHLPNGDPQCPAGQWVNAMNPMACATPVAAGGGTYPAGNAPQVTGYSGANVPEAETVSQDCTFTRAGANSYTITCTKAGNGTGAFQAGMMGVGVAAPGAAGELQVNNSEGIGIAPAATAGTLRLSESIGVNTPPAAVAGVVAIGGNNGSFECTAGGGVNVACLKMNIGSGLFQEIGLNSSNQVVFGNSSTGPSTLFEAGVANHLIFGTANGNLMDMTGQRTQIVQGSINALEMVNNSVFSFPNVNTNPSLTAGCNGAGSSVDPGASDNVGYITTQTANSTTCTLTFTVGFDSTLSYSPHCGCGDANATTSPLGCSVDTVNTTSAAMKIDYPSTASHIFWYHCF